MPLRNVVLGVLLAVAAPTTLAPGPAAAQGGTACSGALAPGTWTGSYEVAERLRFQGAPATGRSQISGEFALEVACGDTITGTFTLSQQVTVRFGRGRATITGSCTTPPVTLDVTRATSSGFESSLPTISLEGRTAGRARVTCRGSGGRGFGLEAGMGIPTGMLLVPSSISRIRLDGIALTWTAPQAFVNARARIWTVVSSTVSWFIETEPEAPVVTDITSQYVAAFLQGVRPVPNRFGATVDWKQSTPESVIFTLKEVSRPGVPQSDGTWAAAFEVGDLDASSDLQVVATNEEGRSSDRRTLTVTIIPKPPWAKALTWSAGLTPATVLYWAPVQVPPTPIDRFAITLPGWLPLIGGRWGLAPTQFGITVAASSLQTPTSSQRVTSSGGVAMGRDRVGLVTRGPIVAQLGPGELRLLPSSITADLERPLRVSSRVGVESLVPGLGSLTSGDGLLARALRTVLPGIDLAFQSDASVKAKVGVVEGDQRMDLTDARGTLQLLASAATGFRGEALGYNLLSVSLELKLDGRVTADLVPDVRFAGCTLDLVASAEASSDAFDEPARADVTVPLGCPRR